MTRYCLRHDGRSSWYMIPVDIIRAFDVMLTTAEHSDDFKAFDDQFSAFRLKLSPQRLSFSEPRFD